MWANKRMMGDALDIDEDARPIDGAVSFSGSESFRPLFRVEFLRVVFCFEIYLYVVRDSCECVAIVVCK